MIDASVVQPGGAERKRLTAERMGRACHMTEEHTGASTRTSTVIGARPEELHALIDWLPPAEMTGEIHEFDARAGGGDRMSLFYPSDERAFRGKTSESEEMVNVRFVEPAPP
jgi:hypothetical protein